MSVSVKSDRFSNKELSSQYPAFPELVAARFKYWAWAIMSKSCLGLMYFVIIAEGLRQLVPMLGQRLSKAIPGLSFLNDYEATYKLDIAPFFAVFLLIAVWFLWAQVIQIWVLEDHEKYYSDRHKLLLAILAIIVLFADAYLFYSAVSQFVWSSSFSFSSIVVTLAYIAVLVFVIYLSLLLRSTVRDLKGK